MARDPRGELHGWRASAACAAGDSTLVSDLGARGGTLARQCRPSRSTPSTLAEGPGRVARAYSGLGASRVERRRHLPEPSAAVAVHGGEPSGDVPACRSGATSARTAHPDRESVELPQVPVFPDPGARVLG